MSHPDVDELVDGIWKRVEILGRGLGAEIVGDEARVLVSEAKGHRWVWCARGGYIEGVTSRHETIELCRIPIGYQVACSPTDLRDEKLPTRIVQSASETIMLTLVEQYVNLVEAAGSGDRLTLALWNNLMTKEWTEEGDGSWHFLGRLDFGAIARRDSDSDTEVNVVEVEVVR